MNQKIYTKNIFVIGLLLVLSSAVLLPSCLNYFNKNNNGNNTSNPRYKTNIINFNTNRAQEEKNIILQISILKSAISKNNFTYQSYNKIFEHNISYVRNQKNIMKNKINIANYSIRHEINILDDMINIIYTHSYNYLQFFKVKNYVLPQIAYSNNTDINSSINSIETYTDKITKSSTSVSNISFHTEEDVIGIKNISSLISGTKKLIFSKINFDYNNIFYYSNYSNNLTTLHEYTSSYNQYINNNSIKSNQFITNNNINSSDESKNNLTFSFTKNKIIKYIQNKPYVVAVPGGVLFGLAITGVVVYIYKRIAKVEKAKLYSQSTINTNNLPKNNIVNDYLLPNTGARKFTNERLEHFFNNGSFVRKLYAARAKANKIIIPQDVFKEQVSNLLYLIHSKSSDSNFKISHQYINNYIKDRLGHRIERQYNGESNEIKDMLQSVTDTNQISTSGDSFATTTNSLFAIPAFDSSLKYALTEQQNELIVIQIKKFKVLLSSLPEHQNIPELFNFIEDAAPMVNDDNSKVVKIVGSIIINDLRELIEANISHLQYHYFHQHSLSRPNVTLAKDEEIANYYLYFTQTHLIRDNFYDLRHIGISIADFTSLMSDFSN